MGEKMGNRAAGQATLQRQGRVDWLSASKTLLARQIREAHESCRSAVEGQDKAFVRGLHYRAREQGELVGSHHGLVHDFARHLQWFKTGADIDPAKIRVKVRLVESRDDERLWCLARACWSMPYSKGYGRRLRFLVIDDEHDALIGILGLQSPPADLACRDALFRYPSEHKLSLVNQTMDAYTVGAIPPYSFILGSKLCAGLLATDPIREAYWRRYASRRTEMLGSRIQQPLVAITTTSAFGRSSVYNRLRMGPRWLAKSIGYTKGYGMLHLEHLYAPMCDLLRASGELTPNGYGHGPKVRWQNVTKALMHLGLPLDLLAHGVQREVFLFELTDQLDSGMSGGSFGAPRTLSAGDFAQYWLSRWALSRAARYPEWRGINARALVHDKVCEWDRIARARKMGT